MPPRDVGWIGPEAVHHDALILWLLESVCLFDVLELDSVFGEQPSVGDEYLLVNAVTQWKLLEHVVEEVVGLQVVLVLHLPLESIELVQILCFVVSSAHKEMVGVAHLPREQAHYHLHGETSSVNEVAIENIGVRLGRNSVDLEDIQEIVVLAVDVSADSDFLVVFSLDLHK